MRKLIVILLSALMMVSALTACGGSIAEFNGLHINAILNSEPATLDQARFLGITDRTVLFSVTEPLTRIVDGVVTEAGAQTVLLSDDGLTYTFTIRENYWSDGQRVTAKDYLAGLQCSADPKNAFSFASDFFSIVNFEAVYNGKAEMEALGVSAPDDQTLIIQLADTNSAFLSSVDIFPVREDMVAQYGDQYGSEAESILSCGPFVLDEWVHNSQMDFSKNAQYWDRESVKLDGFTYFIITDESAQMASLENGSVDYATVNTQEYADRFAANSNMEQLNIAAGRTTLVIFNCEDEVFSNVKIRQAFALAVDRDILVEIVTGGLGAPAYGLVPEDCSVGDTNFRTASKLPSLLLADAHPDARALLIEGMQETGLGTDPAALTVTFSYGGTDAASRTHAELYQQMWQTVLGVTVEIDFNETATNLSYVNEGNYQIASVGWGSTVEPSFQLSRWATPKGGQSQWVNEEYVRLVTEGMAEVDDNKRLELYQQAEKLLVESAAIVPCYYTAQRIFAYSYVGGIPTGAFDTTGMKTLYIEE